LRLGDAPGARALLAGFFEKMSESDHMYRDAMSAAAACVSGDVELRHGESSTALAAYRRAWHTVQEHPRVMAYQRIAARAQAGLGAAYAAAGDRNRALELLTRAEQTARESELPEHNAAAASLPELYWSVGSGWARLGDSPKTMEAIRNSIRTGWCDAAWMERDPEFGDVRGTPEFARLFSKIQMVPLSFEAIDRLSSGQQQPA